MDWTAELASAITGQVLTDEVSRLQAATDFGRVVEKRPAVVVRPSFAQDVAEVVKFAASHSLRVAARGAGHSQNGQSLSDDIVLDMHGLDRILRVDENGPSVTCQAGITWRALLAHLLPLGLSPPVLTNNLDVTVGGTLSTAGLGVASWREGSQADHVSELEVVTGTGNIVRCSPDSGKDLFDAVRAGLGQFGVITEATITLRKHQPKARTFYLLYDGLGALLNDLKTLMQEERFDCLESWCVPLPQGLKKAGGQRKPFAEWFFPLHVTAEFDGAAPEAAEKLRDLHFYKHVHTEDWETPEFYTRLDPLFELWKRGGFWDYAHPWMECILPWDAAAFYIQQVLQNFPPQALAGGHMLLWPARGSASSVPLFVRPEGDALLGFGILPAVPQSLLSQVLPMMEKASQATMLMGGKRYLSGWLPFTIDQWKAHYGALWPVVEQLKEKYDPQRVFGELV